MATKRWVILLFTGLLLIFTVIMAGVFLDKSQNPVVLGGQLAKKGGAVTVAGALNAGAQSAGAPVSETQGLSALSEAATPALVPGSTLFPLPTAYAPAQWNNPPTCANQPANNAALAQSLAAGVAASDYRRAVLLSPVLGSLNPEQFNALLAGQDAETAVYTRRTLASLAVNIATGRLNRASAVAFPDLPQVKTVGDLLARMEESATQGSAAPAVLQASQQVLNGQGITQAVCAHLLTTQTGGGADDIRWSAGGLQTRAFSNQLTADTPLAVDGVTVSPDGRWAALTSHGNDSGGPVYLLDLTSGAWSDLIARINTALPGDQSKLATDGWWDVIGWMPDSQRLVIGRADASVLMIVETASGKLTAIPFDGGGVGGEMALGLAPDGSQFAFVGPSAAGDGQVLSLYTFSGGEVKPLVTLPYTQGAFYFPRFSPDGKSIAYITQKGQPDKGTTETIARVAVDTGSVTVMVEGSLGLSLPAWSPDGRYLAFVRRDAGTSTKPDPAQPLKEPIQNVWVIDTTSGSAQQMTFIQGQALKPKWAPDAKTLSFVTHDGQVGLVSLSAPGQIWRAAGSADAQAGFNSASFIP